MCSTIQVTLPIQMSVRMRPIAVDMGLASISGPLATPPNSATAIVGGLETAAPSVSLHLFCVNWCIGSCMYSQLFQFISAASSLTDATINPNDYTLIRELHPKLMLYARIDGVRIAV